MSENDLEKPVPDAEEQRREVGGDPDTGGDEELATLPFDANEADAFEQHQEVSLDEDDYR